MLLKYRLPPKGGAVLSCNWWPKATVNFEFIPCCLNTGCRPRGELCCPATGGQRPLLGRDYTFWVKSTDVPGMKSYLPPRAGTGGAATAVAGGRRPPGRGTAFSVESGGKERQGGCDPLASPGTMCRRSRSSVLALWHRGHVRPSVPPFGCSQIWILSFDNYFLTRFFEGKILT